MVRCCDGLCIIKLHVVDVYFLNFNFFLPFWIPGHCVCVFVVKIDFFSSLLFCLRVFVHLILFFLNSFWHSFSKIEFRHHHIQFIYCHHCVIIGRFFLFIYDALLFSIETTHAHTHNNSDNKRIGHHTFVSTSFVSNINVPSYQFKYNDHASIEFHNIGSKSYVFSFHIFLFESIFLNFLSLSLYYYLNLN